jgi:hypothetical protein
MRGRRIRLSQPRLFHDEARRAIPAPLRPFLRLLQIYDFLELQPAADEGPATPGAGR